MKASTILVCPTVHLPSFLSDAERDVLRKVLLDNIRGVDADHDKRWRRFVGGLINAQPGEVTSFLNPRTRSLPFHKRVMTIERRVFENQDCFEPTDAGRRAFRNWMKVGASLAQLELAGGEPRWVPGSCSFDEMSDDEFREYHAAAVAFLRSAHALATLWPVMKPEARAKTLELLLEKQEENQSE